MKDFTTNETLLAKLAFEKLCSKADCSVKHYQADNGQFSDNEFLAACNNLNQTIECCELVHTIKMDLSKTETNS
jgi:hypothetical protein